MRSIVIYLVIYAAMNLGAFAVVIAVARKTRSAEIELVRRACSSTPRAWPRPWSIFLFSLAGIPPLGGWFAKFVIFQSLVSAGTTGGYVLAVIVGVNSVIALFYYARDRPDDVHGRARRRRRDPDPGAGLAHRGPGDHRVITVVFGVSRSVTRFTEHVTLLGLGG